MDSACRQFLSQLERTLAGRGACEELVPLGWHEHLLSCASCRALLEREEALEALLASLPNPCLEPEMVERLLVRLQADRRLLRVDRALDELLETSVVDAVPHNLARRVLAGLEGARQDQPGPASRVQSEAALDGLLERLPLPCPPEDLARSVLSSLEEERAVTGSQAVRPTTGLRLVPTGRRVLVASIAAAAILCFAGGRWWFLRHAAAGQPPFEGTPSGGPMIVAPGDQATTDNELLASLDVLESWDMLMSEDVDLLLAGMDPVDVALVQIGGDG